MNKKIKPFILLFVFVCVGVMLSACTVPSYISKIKTITTNEEEYNFSNNDLKLSQIEENSYQLKGSADYFSDSIKKLFQMSTNHMVALQIEANQVIVKAEVVVVISTDNATIYKNGDNIAGENTTINFLIDVIPSQTYTITTKWNANDTGTTYTIQMDSNIVLKTAN